MGKTKQVPDRMTVPPGAAVIVIGALHEVPLGMGTLAYWPKDSLTYVPPERTSVSPA